MAISYVGSSTHADGSTGTTRTPDLTALTLQADDLLYAVVGSRISGNGADGGDPITPPAGEGWSLADDTGLTLPAGNGANHANWVYVKRWGTGATDDSTPTFTNSASGNWGVQIAVFRGTLNTENFEDRAQTATFAASATPEAPAATSSGAGRAVIRIWSTSDRNALSTPSSGTLAFGSDAAAGGTGYSIALSYELGVGSGSTGTTTITETANGNDGGGSYTFVLAPAPSGPTISDVETDEEFRDGDTGVTVTGTTFEATQNTGKVELGSAATYGASTLVEQTVTSWSDTSIDFTAVLGALAPGALWLYVTNDTGDTSAGFPVTVHRKVAFVLSATANIAASGETTTAQLTPPSGKTTGDSVGRIQDDENPTDATNPGTDGYFEDEWCIEATADSADVAYQFRVLVDGQPLDTYTVDPRVTISSAATYEQEGYRVRNDDGSESAATWRAAQDTNVNLHRGELFRLRTLVDVSGTPGSAVTRTLQFRRVGDPGWTTVGAAGAIVLSDNLNSWASNLSSSATTAQLTPPSGKTTGDSVGRAQDSANPTAASDPGTDGYFEDEWALFVDQSAIIGDAYQFRVLVDGTPVGTETVDPRITIAETTVPTPIDGAALSENIGTQTKVGPVVSYSAGDRVLLAIADRTSIGGITPADLAGGGSFTELYEYEAAAVQYAAKDSDFAAGISDSVTVVLGDAAVGDTIVLFYLCSAGSAPVTPSGFDVNDTFGTGAASNPADVTVLVKTVTSPETATYEVFPDGTHRKGIIGFRFPGAVSVTAGNHVTGSNSQPDPPAAGMLNGDMAIAIAVKSASVTAFGGAPTGYSELIEQNCSIPSANMACAIKAITTTGTENPDGFPSTPQEWAANTYIVRRETRFPAFGIYYADAVSGASDDALGYTSGGTTDKAAAAALVIETGTFDPSTPPEFAVDLNDVDSVYDPPSLTPSWAADAVPTLWGVIGGFSSSGGGGFQFAWESGAVDFQSFRTIGFDSFCGNVFVACSQDDLAVATLNPSEFTGLLSFTFPFAVTWAVKGLDPPGLVNASSLGEASTSAVAIAASLGGAGAVGEGTDSGEAAVRAQSETGAVDEALDSPLGRADASALSSATGEALGSVEGEGVVHASAEGLGEALSASHATTVVGASAGSLSEALSSASDIVEAGASAGSLSEEGDAAGGQVEAVAGTGEVAEGSSAVQGVATTAVHANELGEALDGAKGVVDVEAEGSELSVALNGAKGLVDVEGSGTEVSEVLDGAKGLVDASGDGRGVSESVDAARGLAATVRLVEAQEESLATGDKLAAVLAPSSEVGDGQAASQASVQVLAGAHELGDSLSGAFAPGVGEAARRAGGLGEALDSAQASLEVGGEAGGLGEALDTAVGGVLVLGSSGSIGEGIEHAARSSEVAGVTHTVSESEAQGLGVGRVGATSIALEDAIDAALGVATEARSSSELAEGLEAGIGVASSPSLGVASSIGESISGGFAESRVGAASGEIAESSSQTAANVIALANVKGISEAIAYALGEAIGAGTGFAHSLGEGLTSAWGTLSVFVPPRDVSVTFNKTTRVSVTFNKTTRVPLSLRKVVVVSVAVNSVTGEDLVVGDQVEVIATYKDKDGNVFNTATARIRLLNTQSNTNLKAEGGQLVQVSVGVYSATFNLDYAGYWHVVADQPPGRGVGQLSFSVKPKAIPD